MGSSDRIFGGVERREIVLSREKENRRKIFNRGLGAGGMDMGRKLPLLERYVQTGGGTVIHGEKVQRGWRRQRRSRSTQFVLVVWSFVVSKKLRNVLES